MSEAERVEPEAVLSGGLAPIPRVALTRKEAAEALSMSLTSFEQYVQPELRIVRRGRLRIVATRELERWMADNAERLFE